MAMAGRLVSLAWTLPDHLRTALWGTLGHRLHPGSRRVVQAVVLSSAGVLLCVRRELHGWELPGGHPAPGESEPDALAREVCEETGVRVVVEALVGEYRRSGFLPHVARVYRCHPAPDGPVRCGARTDRAAPAPPPLRASAETPRVAWWDPADLPATLLPWYRRPLEDGLRPAAQPVLRQEHQGLREIWAGLRIDLRMRLSDDRAR